MRRDTGTKECALQCTAYFILQPNNIMLLSHSNTRPLGLGAGRGHRRMSQLAPLPQPAAPSRLVCRYRDATSATEKAVDAPSWRR